MLSAAPASAEAETHDGLYLNGQVGFGGSSIVVDNPGTPDIQFDNGNGDFSFDVGLAVTPELVAFARFWTFAQTNPSAETAGMDIELGEDVSVNAYALGAGARYYFMPLNFYVGGSLGFGRFTVTEDGDALAKSDWGFGLALELGKEWWVSADWALGVGGRFSHVGADARPDGSISGNALGVLFTATYN